MARRNKSLALMKTAVILLGNIRTWEKCHESFRQKFNNTDVFINTYDAQYMTAPYIQQITNFYDEVILDQQDILNMFIGIDVKGINVENSLRARFKVEQDKLKFKLSFEPHDVTVFYGQYLKLKESLDMIKQYELEHNFRYDYIVKTRFDIVYNDFDLINDNQSILIDTGNVKPNDHFFMCNRDSFEEMVNFMHAEFFNPTCSNSNEIPPHGLLLNGIKHAGLTIIETPIIKHLERQHGTA
jgi:hypothetical protein